MFLESINGFLYYIFLEFVRLFFDCEKRLDKLEVEEDNFTINFTKTYKRDFESIEYDFPILHVNITRKIWYSAQ
jgi:transposase